MAILKAVELLMGVVLLLLATVMFKWWLESEETLLRLVQISLYALLGITIMQIIGDDDYAGRKQRA